MGSRITSQQEVYAETLDTDTLSVTIREHTWPEDQRIVWYVNTSGVEWAWLRTAPFAARALPLTSQAGQNGHNGKDSYLEKAFELLRSFPQTYNLIQTRRAKGSLRVSCEPDILSVNS
ncbi:TPA: hypothetical protein DIV55_01775 [Patescibacteria group bacterium]|uniref:Uncharacterized protein n=1 Tax=Candidatus Gottesmanbacteria bacterium GW2011_GWA1_43_11 TaxID=1618436 RepID=A0A0G1CFS8_9BACT|nr:MAG: hypothetical protein UV59_C0016G0033 [Candidatus Gottesmanbacteria bacterium GW2011_GWA1_43_11]HCS78451.1 hypothetical protein [Patescibacteria group bacterium]